jgi:hypothetical protein
MKEFRILAIVPAYNESGNIKSTLENLKNAPLCVDIVVVDDGSKDATYHEALESGAQVIALPFNLGIGGAVQTGFQYAKTHDYDIVIQFDGDGQHDVRYLTDLIEPIRQGRADMVIGSRFIAPFMGYRSSLIRRMGIHFFAGLLSFLTRCKMTDPTSGFRAYNRKIIALFSDFYPQDFPEPEAIMVARRMRLNVLEIPVQMNKRVHGHSSIRYLKTLYYMVKVTFAILLDLLKRTKIV